MALKPREGDTKKVNGKVYRYQKVSGKRELQWVPLSGLRKLIRKTAFNQSINPYERQHSRQQRRDKKQGGSTALERLKTKGETGLSNIPKAEGNAVIKGRDGKAERLNPDYGVKGQSDRVVNENKRTDKLKVNNETKDEFLKRTKNSPAAKAGLSDAQRWAARQKHLKWKESRNTKEGRRKRITDRLKKKIYKNPHK